MDANCQEKVKKMSESDAREVMRRSGVEYWAVLDVDRYKGRNIEGAALNDVLRYNMASAL